MSCVCALPRALKAGGFLLFSRHWLAFDLCVAEKWPRSGFLVRTRTHVRRSVWVSDGREVLSVEISGYSHMPTKCVLLSNVARRFCPTHRRIFTLQLRTNNKQQASSVSSRRRRQLFLDRFVSLAHLPGREKLTFQSRGEKTSTLKLGFPRRRIARTFISPPA